MSADNWTVCPCCEREEKAKHNRAVAHLSAQYGKVSPDEYLTMREDYFIGIREGEFRVEYTSWCEKCRFSYTHKPEPVDVMPTEVASAKEI